MVINNVMLKLKNRDVSSIQKIKDALLSMKGKIDVLKDIQVETNIRSGMVSYDLIFFAKFASLEDMDAYIKNPIHQEIGKFIAGMMESQASVCYEIK